MILLVKNQKLARTYIVGAEVSTSDTLHLFILFDKYIGNGPWTISACPSWKREEERERERGWDLSRMDNNKEPKRKFISEYLATRIN